MFRYIVADQSLLSTEDKQTYQSFYCGLCRQHKKLAGAKGQKLKESHLCFLAILLNGLYETDAQLEDFRCMTHPAKKKQGFSSEAIEYTVAMDILLSQSNGKDYDRIKEQYHGRREKSMRGEGKEL